VRLADSSRMRKGGHVESDARRAAVLALVRLGRSDDFKDRADAGHSLAGFAEVGDAVVPLSELLLDPGDTLVTRRTAEGLLRRNDAAGLKLVASALAAADDNHADWIESTTVEVFSIYSEELDEARRICEQIAADPSTDASGVIRLRAILAEIDPVLRPA